MALSQLHTKFNQPFFMQMEIVHAKCGSCCVKSHGSLSNRIIAAYLGRVSSSIRAYHDDGRLMDVLTSSLQIKWRRHKPKSKYSRSTPSDSMVVMTVRFSRGHGYLPTSRESASRTRGGNSNRQSSHLCMHEYVRADARRFCNDTDLKLLQGMFPSKF